jgi:protein-tyrosine phosphatase
VIGFVDVHSHVIPSGDDGARSVDDGLELCREASRRETRILYGTPHVWPVERLSAERERAVREAHAAMARRLAGTGIELRLGFELTPSEALLRESLERYALSGLDVPTLLVEFPFEGELDLLATLCERAEADGFRLVLAHPERSTAVMTEPDFALELAAPGRLLQVNATSLLGRHGPVAEEIGWDLLERGLASLVASDGHRTTRPPHLDAAFRAALERLGDAAERFFDGSALVAQAPQPAGAG